MSKKQKVSSGTDGSDQSTSIQAKSSDQSSTEIVPQNQSIENLIAQAIDRGTPVETMERLMAMRRELKAEYAKEQFDKAMADFQSKCPTIKKEKPGGKTNAGVVAYYYAPLESIVEQVKDIIKESGFSYAIQTKTEDKAVKVTCTVKHTAGHSESSDVQVPLGEGTRVMSAPQIVASALTFAKRYAFCNAFGILTGEDDNDAQEDQDKTIKKKKTAHEKLMSMVDKCSIEELKEYKSKLEKSDKYTEDQKAEFCIAVDEKIKELEK